mgnify:CR=1 FL=1
MTFCSLWRCGCFLGGRGSNTGVNDLVDDEDALVVAVFDLDIPVVFVGVEGRRVGLESVLEEGEGVLPLLNKLVLRGEHEVVLRGEDEVVGVKAVPVPGLLRGVLLCISLGFDLLNCEDRNGF